ncbi:MAG: peptidoglycan-binding protein [Calothrix sp. C42_A2020_038]|nr:peptidoglycan-binding protein [Calothrix sp. C42_A2020_038]
MTSRLSEEQVKADKELVTHIQIKLRGLGLYPGGKFIDGDFGPRTRNAIKNFCEAIGIPFPQYDRNFAQNLLTKKQLPSVLRMAANREQTFQNLLSIAKATKLATNELAPFLHRDLHNSKYITEIAQYAQRLTVKHETQVLPLTYTVYPKRGVIPAIDNQALNFLHSDIQEACVCIGNFVNEEIQTRWLGKNALEERQFWSTTKIIPILNVISEANTRASDIDTANCYINERQYLFNDIVLDIISYKGKITSSNAAAACLKLFQTPISLETWVKNITGNQQLSFRSGYGENAFIRQPKLIDRVTGKQVLSSPGVALEVDKNYLSAYDLTRIISMLGWHPHLPEHARLPGARWQSLKSIIGAIGSDRARYIDVAIETLGLENVISSPVIISKLGNGFSDSRGSHEIAYVALIEFIDEQNRSTNQLGKFRTLAMTMRGVVKPPRTLVELDARIAADVTEIIRRIVVNEIT